MRRLKKGIVSRALIAGSMRSVWLLSRPKEHVFRDPTSVALYETITARQREEDAELARAERQLEMEHDRERD